MTAWDDLDELLRCCRVLFGDEVSFSDEFLTYLQLGGVRSAYRRMVRKTHPDVAGVDADSVTLFLHVQHAYNTLAKFLEEREQRSNLRQRRTVFARGKENSFKTTIVRRTKQSSTETQSRATDLSDAIRPFTVDDPQIAVGSGSRYELFYEGPVPQRRLLFGNFLYYGGLTNWRTISRVLTWQRLERPRLGELGARFGLLVEDEVQRIVEHQLGSAGKFGETARRLGLLDERRVRFLLEKQLQQQKKFGRILVERELLELDELLIVLARFRHHNRNSSR